MRITRHAVAALIIALTASPGLGAGPDGTHTPVRPPADADRPLLVPEGAEALGADGLVERASRVAAGERRQVEQTPLGAARTGLSLAVVLGLIFAGAWLVRRMAKAHGGLAAAMGPGGRSPSGLLEVLGRYPVGHRQTLVLLKFDRRVLLLVQTAGTRARGSGLSVLCEVTDPEDIASILVKARDAAGESIAERFHEVLSKSDSEAFGDDEPVGEAGSRRAFTSPEGDRVELWQDEFAAAAQEDPDAGADTLSPLRRRLEAMRVGGRDA